MTPASCLYARLPRLASAGRPPAQHTISPVNRFTFFSLTLCGYKYFRPLAVWLLLQVGNDKRQVCF